MREITLQSTENRQDGYYNRFSDHWFLSFPRSLPLIAVVTGVMNERPVH